MSGLAVEVAIGTGAVLTILGSEDSPPQPVKTRVKLVMNDQNNARFGFENRFVREGRTGLINRNKMDNLIIRKSEGQLH